MHNSHALLSVIILLAVAVLAVPIARRLGLGSVIGYLVAGALVGPWGFQLIVEVEQIRAFAEFGVILLLFVIGIELNPRRLWTMRRLIFGLGSLQMLTTGAAIIAIAVLLGVPLNTAVVVGFGLALSSTAFGLQILLAIITGILSAVITLPITAIVLSDGVQTAGDAIVQVFIQTVALLLFAPLSAVAAVVLYFDLRVRKEGFDLLLQQQNLASGSSSAGTMGTTPYGMQPPVQPTQAPPQSPPPAPPQWGAPPPPPPS